MDELEQIKKLLHDHLYSESKDWRHGNVVERVEWLLSMYESKKAETDNAYRMLDTASMSEMNIEESNEARIARESQEAECAAKDYHAVIQAACDEWEENGLETICPRDSFIVYRMRQAGYE